MARLFLSVVIKIELFLINQSNAFKLKCHKSTCTTRRVEVRQNDHIFYKALNLNFILMWSIYFYRYGLLQCGDSLGDCLLSFFCGCCYSCYVSDLSGEKKACSILQCLCYPCGLCYLRPQIRKKKGINVRKNRLFPQNLYDNLWILFILLKGQNYQRYCCSLL